MTIIAKLDQSVPSSVITNTGDFSNVFDAPTSLQAPAVSPAASLDSTIAAAGPVSAAIAAGPDSLNYFVRFTPSSPNGGPLDGSTLYGVDSFSFDLENATTIGSGSGGAGTGKVTLNPLHLVVSDLSLTPALFEMLATGKHFSKVDILGFRQDGSLAIDDSFGTAIAIDLSTDATGATAIALDYAQVSFLNFPGV